MNKSDQKRIMSPKIEDFDVAHQSEPPISSLSPVEAAGVAMSPQDRWRQRT